MIKILLIILTLFFVFQVKAQDIKVECDSQKKCTQSSNYPFFKSSELWFPGKTVNKTVSLKNNSDTTQTINNKFNKISGSVNLEKSITVSIINETANALILKELLKDIYAKNNFKLIELSPQSSVDLKYIFSFDKNSGNNLQKKQTSFDLNIDFIADIEEEITPTKSLKSSATPITVNFGQVISDSDNLNNSESKVQGEVKGISQEDKDKRKIFLLQVFGIEGGVAILYFLIKFVFFRPR